MMCRKHNELLAMIKGGIYQHEAGRAQRNYFHWTGGLDVFSSV